jgi:soluble lytic murein transglycosylase-like protein
MGVVGYSAREIADVIEGRLTRAAVDQAYARRMVGHSGDEVAAFLETMWREPKTAPTRAAVDVSRCDGAPVRRQQVVSGLEADISAAATRHGVPVALVHAVIDAESSGDPCAVSRAGAIGLMQLMPATAAALGVDPWDPRQNVEGGIAYLASLLRTYGGDARLALIAYNAGPQHADRVKAGRAVAYHETRRYLEAIARRYPL